MVNFNLCFTPVPTRSDLLDPQSIQKFNHIFEKTFSPTLMGMLEELLKDPVRYKDKIEQYENKYAQRPEIPFDTENQNYEQIIKDPIRIKEEQFLYQSLLEHENLFNQENFFALDLGTGGGRMAFCILDILFEFYPRENYKICGLDINLRNILDANYKIKGGDRENIKFIKADMIKTPFRDSLFSLCNICTASYLVPLYERPLLLLEMCRILQVGGEGIITGINRKFSLSAYAKCMAASNFWTYLNPFNFYLAQQSVPIGMLVSEMCQKRKDFTPSDPEELCTGLKSLGCEVKKVETWPENSTIEDFYAGIHFRVTPETKRILKQEKL